MSVISLRLKEKEFARLKELSKSEQKDKSTVARELMEYGWEFLMIKLYRNGKLSLGTLASKMGLSVSETIDLLADFGIESPVEYDDYLSGLDVLRSKKNQ
jgi:predicted HTH domain antitoxin